jgi:hypothetical protein
MFKGVVWLDNGLDTANLPLRDRVLLSSDAKIAGFDVSKETDFRGLFKGSQSNADISKWDVANGVSFNYMFEGAAEFNSNLHNWHPRPGALVTDMFKDAGNFDCMHLPENVYGPDGTALRKARWPIETLEGIKHVPECFPLAKFVFTTKKPDSATTLKNTIVTNLANTLGYGAEKAEVEGSTLTVEVRVKTTKARSMLDEIEKKLESDTPEAAASAACGKNIKSLLAKEDPFKLDWNPNHHFKLTFKSQTELTDDQMTLLKDAIAKKAGLGEAGLVSVRVTAQLVSVDVFFTRTKDESEFEEWGNSFKTGGLLRKGQEPSARSVLQAWDAFIKDTFQEDGPGLTSLPTFEKIKAADSA